MSRLLLVLAVSFGSLGAGYLLQVILVGPEGVESKKINDVSRKMKLIPLLVKYLQAC